MDHDKEDAPKFEGGPEEPPEASGGGGSAGAADVTTYADAGTGTGAETPTQEQTPTPTPTPTPVPFLSSEVHYAYTIPMYTIIHLDMYKSIFKGVEEWATGTNEGSTGLFTATCGTGHHLLMRALTSPVEAGGLGWTREFASQAEKEFMRFMVHSPPPSSSVLFLLCFFI
jgi:hypothetical protein